MVGFPLFVRLYKVTSLVARVLGLEAVPRASPVEVHVGDEETAVLASAFASLA